jgi:hypothetical protein
VFARSECTVGLKEVFYSWTEYQVRQEVSKVHLQQAPQGFLGARQKNIIPGRTVVIGQKGLKQ